MRAIYVPFVAGVVRIRDICSFIVVEFIGCGLRLCRCGACSMLGQAKWVPTLRFSSYLSFGPEDSCMENDFLSDDLDHLKVP